MGTPQDPPYPMPPPFPLPDPDAPPDPDGDDPKPDPRPSSARDPRTDPHPGDLVRRDGTARRVIKRDGERILVSSGTTRYWMRVDRWREWYEKTTVLI